MEILLKAELCIDFCGVRLKNPFLLSASPATSNAQRIRLAAKKGWAGAVTTTVWSRPPKSKRIKHPRPNYWISSGEHAETRSFFAFQNTGSSLENESWIKREMKAIRRVGLPIIGSIMGSKLDDWPRLAKMMEEAGADILELNVSCPYLKSSAKQPCGPMDSLVRFQVGQDPELTQSIVAETRKACRIPVTVKLPGGIAPSNLTDVAKAVEKAGADAISVTNTILGLLGIDIESGIPIPFLMDKRGQPKALFSGISGPAIRPISLRCVAQIAACTKVQVAGVGGITDWRSATEFLMAGATCVQCATGPLIYGYDIVKAMTKGLQVFMERKGFESIDDFRGSSLKYFSTFEALDLDPAVKAIIDDKRCNICGRCIVACNTGGNYAIIACEPRILNAKAQAKSMYIRSEKCVGCGLCLAICPKRAISLKTPHGHD